MSCLFICYIFVPLWYVQMTEQLKLKGKIAVGHINYLDENKDDFLDQNPYNLIVISYIDYDLKYFNFSNPSVSKEG